MCYVPFLLNFVWSLYEPVTVEKVSTSNFVLSMSYYCCSGTMTRGSDVEAGPRRAQTTDSPRFSREPVWLKVHTQPPPSKGALEGWILGTLIPARYHASKTGY